MIAVETRIDALKKVFAAYRADTSPLVAKAYKDGLADIPDDVLVKAIDAAILGEAFMPTVARIRTYADRFRPEVPALPEPTVDASHYLTGQVEPLEDDDPRTWKFCGLCRDTGWFEEQRECYLNPQKAREMRSYFSHCKCRATNPKLIADRQRTAKYSREREE